MSVCSSVCDLVSEPQLLKDVFNSRRELLLNFQFWLQFDKKFLILHEDLHKCLSASSY
jgi:hypothetical protein